MSRVINFIKSIFKRGDAPFTDDTIIDDSFHITEKKLPDLNKKPINIHRNIVNNENDKDKKPSNTYVNVKELPYYSERNNNLIKKYDIIRHIISSDAPNTIYRDYDILNDDETKMYMGWKFNDVIEIGSFPDSLQYLKMSMYLNKQILPCTFSNTCLTVIEFGQYYNQIILPDTFPETLLKLIFLCGFDQQIKPNSLPNSLQVLQLGCDYNKQFLPYSLPKSLIELETGSKYNHVFLENTISNTSITKLVISYHFDSNILPYTFPLTLKTLIFIGIFNKEIKRNVLSQLELEELQFGYGFKHYLTAELLPKTLKTLKLYNTYNNFDLNKLDCNIVYY